MNKFEPTFPIIRIFNKEEIIYGCTNQHDYSRCDITYLSNFKNAIVIDSKGIYYLIENAKKIGWGYLLWGYHPLMKGRAIKIEFQYAEIKQLQYEEFKSIIVENLKGNDNWYANSKKSILKALDDGKPFKEIIEMFSYDKS